MKHISLFSGIGGFDLAAEWMGWENVAHCEWNEFGRKILQYYWSKAKSYEDITKTDFNIYRGRIDIVTGGFPCQPYSTAGKRLGKEDDRHLWPEMLRAIREIKPHWVVAENVSGLVNWNEGLVFNEVQTDLEAEGYEIQPVLLPACGVNAPHRRERVWFIAYSNGNDVRRTTGKNESSRKREGVQERYEVQQPVKSNQILRNVTDPERIGPQRPGRSQEQISTEKNGDWQASWADNDGGWPNESPLCVRDDGFSSQLDGITISKWETETLKGGGNAIVPQVAHQIFKTIEQYEQLNN